MTILLLFLISSKFLSITITLFYCYYFGSQLNAAIIIIFYCFFVLVRFGFQRNCLRSITINWATIFGRIIFDTSLILSTTPRARAALEMLLVLISRSSSEVWNFIILSLFIELLVLVLLIQLLVLQLLCSAVSIFFSALDRQFNSSSKSIIQLLRYVYAIWKSTLLLLYYL